MSPGENAITEAEKAGFDLSLVDSNLRLNHDQRAERHASALELALALREAGREHAEPPLAAGPAR